MPNVYTVAFFGHRNMEDPYRVEQLLESRIRDFVREKEYVEFLVGRNGEFDQCAASTVLRVRKNYRDDNSALVLVLPYATAALTRDKQYLEAYYSEIEVCAAAARAYPKAAIGIRNREMVERADAIICYVEKKSGGAYKAMQYALSQGKPVINLSKETEENV